MVNLLNRLEWKLMKKGFSRSRAIGTATNVLTRAGDLNGKWKPTPKWIKRGKMTPTQRASTRKR